MKKLSILTFLLLSILSFSQTELPKTATDISPLLIGELIPNVSVENVDQKEIAFNEITKGKKTILIVYRGGWCPYCTEHLAAVGQSEAALLKLGYQIIAVSPDAPANLKETIGKEKLNYTLFSDTKGNLSKALGVAFTPPAGYDKYLLKGSNGGNSSFVPVPSIFFINEKNEISFEYINPSYKTRISNEMLVAVATTIK